MSFNSTSMRRFITWTGIASLALLSACNFSLSPRTIGGVPLSDTASLTINEQISIKPENTRVFIQDGIVVSQFNHYKHNCNLEVRKRDDNNFQFINPGSYRIHSIQNTLEQVVRFNPGETVNLAFLDSEGQIPGLLLAGVDDSPSDIYLGMHFYLEGEDSNIMRLSCRGALAPPWDAQPPTLAEIRQALGNLATLQM